MDIYLSGSYERRQELLSVAKRLQAKGHNVTSQWLAGNEDMSPAVQALMDLNDIDDARVFVAFTEPPGTSSRGGRHVEFGYALAHKRYIYIVGPRESTFYEIPVVQVDTVDQLLKCLDRLAQQSHL